MNMVMTPRLVDRPRRLLALILALIGGILVVGGAQLIMAGGSPYYVIAGIAVVLTAYLSWRGDARGRWVYAAMLVGTLAWALWESGPNVWGLQARLLAPTVLGLWVFFPVLRKWTKSFVTGAFLVLLGLVWVYTGGADPIVKPQSPVAAQASGRGDWPHYGNDLGGTRYSPVAHITPQNVGGLKEVWRTRLGPSVPGTTAEATPLMVNNTLYTCTAGGRIIALDPETGHHRWTYDPKVAVPYASNCRGVAFHQVPGQTGPCAKRIIFATFDARLMAVDADSGQLCRGFGENGAIDQSRGLGPLMSGYYRTHSAPVIVRGNVVTGAWVTDNQYVGEPSGVIRGYDAVTGKLAWAWDMGHPERRGEPPEGETYTKGTPNSWAPMSGDETLGLVYLPMGNPTPDAWGAHRSPESEKYGSAVVALDAETGQVRWSFQTVHHDLWDYDVPSQPTLIDLPIKGRMVPALIQPTKRGQIFVLDRRTGVPLTRVEERPVPQGAAPGDFLSPTQPFSTGMPVFDKTVLSEQLMWGMTPLDQMWCRIKFRQARYEGPFTPVGVKPTISYPGYYGGVNWGSVAVDPDRRLMVVNWNRMPYQTRLIPRAEADALGIVVSKVGVPQANKWRASPQVGTPFAVAHGFFLSLLDLPCLQPPFAKIAVVDLDQRKVVWERTLGTTADMGPLGMSSHFPLPMGVPTDGGPLLTKTGLIFIGAAFERQFRAFDARDGRKLWAADLPEAATATPMSYTAPRSGRQFVAVISGGRAGLMSTSGEYAIGYALADRSSAK
jgi:quinoprotein glucose dehydrogenase